MIHLIDNDSVLENEEYDELKRYILDQCLCSKTDKDWLHQIIIKNDGQTGYLGYWTCQFDPQTELEIRFFHATIVLNSFYLLTLNQMKKTLAHEYGHHWTLGYMLSKSEQPFNDRLRKEYYQIRGLNPVNNFAPDYSINWYHCDKEIIAEDYKFHFSSFKEHEMKDLVGLPSSEVKDYIMKLCS